MCVCVCMSVMEEERRRLSGGDVGECECDDGVVPPQEKEDKYKDVRHRKQGRGGKA